jgi:ABC-type amino acid transport substrate-binding protein
MPARAIAAAAVLALAATAQAAEPLRVCLDENIPLYSVHSGGEAKGFDVEVAQAVAAQLGRPLEIQWFESKLEEDASAALAANALLSDGRCSLVGGYPLLEDTVGKPGWETGRLPGFEGAKPADRRRRVPLGTLVPSRPYHFAALTIVLGPTAPAKPVNGLADLEGLRLGTEMGGLTDAILMTWHGGKLIDHIRHLVPIREHLLERLEAGDFDAALVDLRAVDAYRAAHPDTKLRLTGWYHHIGFNMGFVALSTERRLVAEVDAALADLAAKGELAKMAQAVGLTYLPPREPPVGRNLTMLDLQEK